MTTSFVLILFQISIVLVVLLRVLRKPSKVTNMHVSVIISTRGNTYQVVATIARTTRLASSSYRYSITRYGSIL